MMPMKVGVGVVWRRQERPTPGLMGTGLSMWHGSALGPRRFQGLGARARLLTPPAAQVFDVELIAVRTCERRQMAMFSDVVCT